MFSPRRVLQYPTVNALLGFFSQVVSIRYSVITAAMADQNHKANRHSEKKQMICQDGNL